MFENRHLILLKRLFLVVLAFTCCRILFLVFNASVSGGSSLPDLVSVLFYGLRFDLFSIFIINTLFILGHILPGNLFYHLRFQQILKVLFLIANIPAIIFNCVDLMYFRFTQKRTTADFFTSEMAVDLKHNISVYLTDFWYILVIIAALCSLLWVGYNRIRLGSASKKQTPILSIAGFIISSALFIVGARGGTQYKPITMQTAASHVKQQLIPAVLNTPFTIIKTLGMKELPATVYMPDADAKAVFPIHFKMQHDTFTNKNVVIILLESFSSEYCGFFNHGKGYTPFLDSLCSKSLVFTSGYANAKRSIEGIPAVTASLPNLMDESFISSAYNTNKINGLGSLLKKYGYRSGFFHGGNNGTMGFESFSHLAGFDAYYGRDEYDGSAADYDGNWGITDEAYYKFLIRTLNKWKPPFYAAVFSLSSHHPYTIPEIYKNKFPKGVLPIHESIGYADYALKTFFMQAQNEPWYKNTIFVLTADHTGPSEKTQDMTSKGPFEIPIIYYCPSDSMLKGINNNTTQQTDILPSVLDYIQYSGTFSAFGTSVFSNHLPFAINYTNNLYQGISNEGLYIFDGENSIGIGYYAIRQDPLLKQNRIVTNSNEVKRLKHLTQAAIQQFRSAMVNNKIIE